MWDTLKKYLYMFIAFIVLIPFASCFVQIGTDDVATANTDTQFDFEEHENFVSRISEIQFDFKEIEKEYVFKISKERAEEIYNNAEYGKRVMEFFEDNELELPTLSHYKDLIYILKTDNADYKFVFSNFELSEKLIFPVEPTPTPKPTAAPEESLSPEDAFILPEEPLSPIEYGGEEYILEASSDYVEEVYSRTQHGISADEFGEKYGIDMSVTSSKNDFTLHLAADGYHYKITFSNGLVNGKAISSAEDATAHQNQSPAFAGSQSAANETPAPTPTPVYSYIGNANSYVFHRMRCSTLPKEYNRIYYYTREQAVNAGMRPCQKCDP